MDPSPPPPNTPAAPQAAADRRYRREKCCRSVLERLQREIWNLRGAEDLDAVLEVIRQGLIELEIPAQGHGINVIDAEQTPARVRVHEATGDGRWITSDLDEGADIIRCIWSSGEVAYRPDLEAADPYNERLAMQRDARIRSVLDIPFHSGTLAVNSTVPDAFSADDIDLLKGLATALSDGFRRLADLERLALSEARYRSLVETPDYLVLLLDPQARYLYVSPQVERWLGYPPAAFYQNPRIAEEFLPPTEVEQLQLSFHRALAGESVPPLEFRWRGRDGTWRWARRETFPTYGPDGNVSAVQIVVHDITEKNEALAALERSNRKLLDTQTQLVRSEKMAALGDLIAGIAHEINTPVGAIRSTHDTLVRAIEKLEEALERDFPASYKDNTGLQRALKVIGNSNRVIDTGCQRVTAIVRSLRNFARLDETALSEIDLHAALDDALMLIYHDTKNRLQIVRDYGQIPPVRAYAGPLNQVFLNLLNNAQQAIDGKGTLTITTQSAGDRVCVAIADDGCGIPPQHLERIFEPGFTTKSAGTGTGLGLSICKRIVDQHKGSLQVASQPGQGTTFTLLLPLDPEGASDGSS